MSKQFISIAAAAVVSVAVTVAVYAVRPAGTNASPHGTTPRPHGASSGIDVAIVPITGVFKTKVVGDDLQHEFVITESLERDDPYHPNLRHFYVRVAMVNLISRTVVRTEKWPGSFLNVHVSPGPAFDLYIASDSHSAFEQYLTIIDGSTGALLRQHKIAGAIVRHDFAPNGPLEVVISKPHGVDDTGVTLINTNTHLVDATKVIGGEFHKEQFVSTQVDLVITAGSTNEAIFRWDYGGTAS